jgi:hypothetical protein
MDKRESIAEIARKLRVIRTAALHSYPVADIDSMLEEIESGYGMNVFSDSPHPDLAERR